MKKGLALLSLLFFITAISHAQNKIQKARAFYTITLPGTQMVDDNGNKVNPPPGITRFILIECKYSSKPKIDSVWINNTAYPAALADEEEKGTNVGINAATGKTVFFSPRKGNHAWKVFINADQSPSPQHNAVKRILLKGSLGKTAFAVTITNEIQLTVPDVY
ncbi:MAG: hypothetical protein JST86_14220 [Bacteroidetes bacterium]|nr:hypothetical protein [Bacteroidota bacterium]